VYFLLYNDNSFGFEVIPVFRNYIFDKWEGNRENGWIVIYTRIFRSFKSKSRWVWTGEVILQNEHFIVCTVHCALCTVHSALCTLHCVCTVYALCMHCVCTVHSALCTLHCVCTVPSINNF
jgi:hypothetical protein